MTSPDSTDSPEGFQRFFPQDTFGSKPFADRSRGPGALGPSTDDRPSDDRKG